MQDVYKNIEEYNSERKWKVLIIFDDIIADIISDKKKLNEIVAELSIRGRKLNISTVFITQSYFALLKDVILNCTHVFIMKSEKKTRDSKKHI